MADLGLARRPSTVGGFIDLRSAVEVAGQPDAPALVLLHGTRRTRGMWRHQLDGLADAFHVVAVDLPGHGALADVRFRLSHASDLVATVIEGLAHGRAIVVGQSLGAYVGMDLAARRPDLVAGLVLANATAEPRTVARQAPRTVGTYLLGAAGDRLRRGNGRPPNGGEPYDEPRGATAGPSAGESPATNGWLFKGGTRAMVSALREAFIPRLAAYPGPTLLINGENDLLFRRGEQAFLAAAVDGRLEVIAGCGHLVNEEQPDPFNAAVRRFSADVDARAPYGSSA